VNLVQHILVLGVRVYQRAISPALAALVGPYGRCRFEPSCSQYAMADLPLRALGRLRR
jgi:putative component of membrane protein insertase Oxa1/YidC/SpoIIIJ protein YidD